MGDIVMGKKPLTGCLAVPGILLALIVPQAAFADVKISGGLETGFSSDSNVGVANVGQSGDDDTAWHTSLDVGLATDLTDKVVFKAGYGFASTQYQNLEELSQNAHTWSTAITARFDKAVLEFSYLNIATALDTDDFLDMQVYSPSVSGFVSVDVYMRAAWSRYNKDFVILNDRDASSDIFTLDTFIFFDSYKSFVDVRITLESEDADADRFDYSGTAVGAYLNLAVEAFGLQNTLELGASRRTRNYDAITPSIATRRDDDKLELEIALEVPVGDGAHIRTGYKHVERGSNLPVADYNEQVVSVTFGFDF